MQLVDNLLTRMKLNTDYDDDDFDFDDEFDDYEEETSRGFFKRSARKDEEENTRVEQKPERVVRSSSKITPMRAGGSKRQVANMEVCVIRPNTFEDAREITDTLINGRTVVLNMEGLNVEVAQRIIDFTCGACYALNGNLQKVSSYIFVITPSSVEISGDFQDMIGGFDVTPMHSI
jgi:cell division inhibitor SepF